MDKAP